ncbi:MAG TPA: hypothetical protein VHW67_07920 [Solirubrobacteraceae bacterium]|jgi:hypothetical protein|nr:hypothetical protein [Solirubrobacteraceae bacterium]
MHRTFSTRLGRLASALLAVACFAAVAAMPAGAATTVTEANFEYGPNSGSAWGNVSCHAKLIVSKKFPSNGPNEGGKEVERCVSTESEGKLTGFFTPGEVYDGYWESDYYHFAATENTTKFPSSLTIKVAKNFKSYRVVATYPAAGNPPEA